MPHPSTKTQYYTASSLDGFVATHDHELGWLLKFGAAWVELRTEVRKAAP